jgi:hypothetical protein
MKINNIALFLSIVLVGCSNKINKKNEEKGIGI